MTTEQEEVQVNYFAICDLVITEAGSSKQSIIGIYTALMTDRIPSEEAPVVHNFSVAIGLRVQSATPRDLTFRLTGPDGKVVFTTPAIPYNWDVVQQGLERMGFAAVQMGLNLRQIPLKVLGIYTAALFCNGAVIATHPVLLNLGPGPGAPPQE